ncbi:MAG: ACP S-malonyltransferase [Elusimicrobia bacterium]|nr:ACP S-malonyltransferase [Elusimicrobiota bacterium]
MSQKVCALFAGQSVQETGMGAALLKIPAARAVVERLKPSLGSDLERLLTSEPEESLALTFNAQRAIHASHVAHWLAYRAAYPDLVLDGAIGHSMGVAAALVAAEAMTVEDSGRFIAARAQAFSDCCKAFSEPMGLAAVSTDDFQDVVESAAEVPGVSVALWNTIGRGTLGGTLRALEAYQAKARAEDWPVKIKILKVEGPYHTAAFAAAQTALEKVLRDIAMRPPKVPVFMGTSGKAETEPARIKELLAKQATACEKHLEAVRNAYAAGCRNFLEVSFKPQPVTWLGEQLIGEDGAPLPGVSSRAIKTEDLA